MDRNSLIYFLIILAGTMIIIYSQIWSRRKQPNSDFGEQSVETMSDNEVCLQVETIINRYATKRDFPTLTVPDESPRFLTNFLLKYRSLTIPAIGDIIRDDLIIPIEIKGNRYLIVGEDEFREYYYIINTKTNAVYEIVQWNDNNTTNPLSSKEEVFLQDSIDCIASSLERAIIVLFQMGQQEVSNREQGQTN